MRRADVEAVGDLAGAALSASSSLIEQMQTGIASRPFGILGVAALPVRKVHDAVAGTVYTGVRATLAGTARGGSMLLAGRAQAEAPALTDGSPGAVAVAALNGLYGHHLVSRENGLALGMELRRHRATVEPSAGGLAAAFPDATGRIVVFVHGLGETDESWRQLPLRGRDPRRRTYGERLQDELSFTPVEVRYNTGRHVSDNGRALARLVDELVGAWPCPVEEVVLIGHSMGGLVARSACHYGEEERLPFTDAVKHVFCLGAPHLGADLEKGVHLLSWAFHRLPETRALGTFLDARSAGIKDMRFGSCVEEDWCDCDPDEFMRDRCQEVPFLPHATYYFIGATLSDGPLGQALGDLLVRTPSASGRGTGRGRSIPFEVDNGRELSGLTHFDLLNHPAVYEQLRMWLTRRTTTRRQMVPA